MCHQLSFQGAVDVREIKEVRPGKNSRDFSKWPEEANNVKPNRCFVVFYGSDFNLKVKSYKYHLNPWRDIWHITSLYSINTSIINPFKIFSELVSCCVFC